MLESLKTIGFIGTLRTRQRVINFLAFAESLKPLRKDRNLEIEEFKSPTALGIKNGAGSYDLPVMASHYVYATFDRVSHPLGNIRSIQGRENPKEKGVRYLDEKDIVNRAQIVMMDIADVQVCANRVNLHGLTSGA